MKTLSQWWTAKLDKFCSDLVKKKASYRCERTGRWGLQIGGDAVLHWAHITSRGKKEVRWGFTLPDGTYFFNALSLSAGSHQWLDNANNRSETQDWLESKCGRMNLVRLRERARITKPWGKQEYEAKWVELQAVAQML